VRASRGHTHRVPTALISGASTGIGRATALRLAASGWTVLAGVRKPADGESLRSAGGERMLPLELDVTDRTQIESAAERVAEIAPGGLNALVNNAGIGIGGPLELISEASLRAQFDVNVFGQVAVTRALLPALRRARGRIVIVSSVGGRVALPLSAPYGASKHALEAIGDALRGELRSSQVRVVLIEPGSVATPIWSKSSREAAQVSIPPELEKEYGHVPAALEKTLRQTEQRGVPAEQVASTIERALTARRPRTRYLVGRDARAMVLGKALLPDRVFDAIVRRAMGL
jgi:NAD(P)-dependent dehydrogenase (short-subunit alcohol dehydrogenase family)